MTSVRRAQNSQGSVTIELVILSPVLIALLLFVVGLGRLAAARSDVDAAARDAARAASLARTTDDAERAGVAAAKTTINEGGVTCRRLFVDIDRASFTADGVVRANVTCLVEIESLTGLHVPGLQTVSASFAEPIDRFRGVR
jgi:Flp pilus assembly protein TadG